jgi:hypothetical protein
MEQERQWRQLDMQQRHLENAHLLWTRSAARLGSTWCAPRCCVWARPARALAPGMLRASGGGEEGGGGRLHGSEARRLLLAGWGGGGKQGPLCRMCRMWPGSRPAATAGGWGQAQRSCRGPRVPSPPHEHMHPPHSGAASPAPQRGAVGWCAAAAARSSFPPPRPPFPPAPPAPPQVCGAQRQGRGGEGGAAQGHLGAGSHHRRLCGGGLSGVPVRAERGAPQPRAAAAVRPLLLAHGGPDCALLPLLAWPGRRLGGPAPCCRCWGLARLQTHATRLPPGLLHCRYCAPARLSWCAAGRRGGPPCLRAQPLPPAC